MSNNKIKVAFLDRDGVINQEVNYLHKIEDFVFTDKCIQGLKNLNEIGFKLIIITNQAGIAKGYYTESQYNILTGWLVNSLKKSGIELLRVYHCPHHPQGVVDKYTVDCDCRKPKAGMLLAACNEFDIDVGRSIIVGDKITDCEAGSSIGIKDCYLVESGHKFNSQAINEEYKILPNLYEVSVLEASKTTVKKT